MTDLEKQISALEQEIIRKKEELYRLKRSVPRFEVKDYALTGRDGKAVRLSELFGARDEMILVHNMGKACPYCTLWADGFTGVRKHLEDRAAFVVATPDDYAEMDAFARSRGWEFTMVSTKGSTLKPDLGYQLADGSYYPGVSSLIKDDGGKIWHVAKAYFGPGDDFCAVWYLFDLLAKQDPDWTPKIEY